MADMQASQVQTNAEAYAAAQTDGQFSTLIPDAATIAFLNAVPGGLAQSVFNLHQTLHAAALVDSQRQLDPLLLQTYPGISETYDTNIRQFRYATTHRSRAEKQNGKIYSLSDEITNVVAIPSAFNWTPSLEIERSGSNYLVNSISNFQPTGTTYYVDKNSGNDSNSGSELEPLQTLSAALSKPDAVVIILAPGTYKPAAITQSLITIKASSRATIASELDTNGVAWSAQGNNVFRATFAEQPHHIVDMNYPDSYGDGLQVAETFNRTDLDSTSNLYDRDGFSIDVRLSDDRQPDSDVRVFGEPDCISYSVFEGTIYVENLDFLGGRFGFYCNGDGAIAYVNNCSARYASQQDGFAFAGGCMGYVFNSLAAANYSDGFDYKDAATRFFEFNCVGRRNGATGVFNNGSTAHDGLSGIRINGSYYENLGPNVADVSVGTQTISLGCSARDSLVPFGNNSSTNFQFADGTYWIENLDPGPDPNGGSNTKWFFNNSTVFYSEQEPDSSSQYINNSTIQQSNDLID